MAEIEHFYDPKNNGHSKFYTLFDVKLPLLTAKSQETNNELITDMKLADAVYQRYICNETLGYYMARTYSFLTDCGIKPEGIRFR